MFLSKVKDRKGFMSIEAVLGMMVVLMVIVLGIGFFSYMIPKQGIEQEVNLLGRMAKMNGGLTESDVDAFVDEMEDRHYKEEDVKVEITLKDSTGVPTTYENANGIVNPLDIDCKLTDKICQNQTPEAEQKYVKREAQLIMEIRAEMPSNKQGLLGAFWFFNVNDDTVSDTYVFKERVMSERH